MTGTDAFVRKYSPDGTELWTRQFGSVDVDRAMAMAVDSTGVYVAGTTNGEFAGPRGQQDGFLAKFSTDGATLLSKQFGTTDYNEEANAVAVGPSGIYVGGRTTGALEGKMPAGLWDGYAVMQFKRRETAVDAADRRAGRWRQRAGLAVGITHLLVTGAADGSRRAAAVGGVDAFYRLYDLTAPKRHARVRQRPERLGRRRRRRLARVLHRRLEERATRSATPVGDNDAFVMKMAPKPLEKEDVKLPAGPARGGGRGAGRTAARDAPETNGPAHPAKAAVGPP